MKSIENQYPLNIFGDVLYTIWKKIQNSKNGAMEILKIKLSAALKIK
jgi:hypothetical protein